MQLFCEIQKIHYCETRPGLFFIPLWLGSLFYSFAIKAKNFLYTSGILKEKKVNAQVICVGNLTTGGVGKTPVVCELANYFTVRGKRVAIISRGYGGSLNNKKVNIVKNIKGEILISDPKLCGDEPYLILQNTAGAAILTCRDRVKAANFAISQFSADILILDDGFSNRKIHKDLNILLVDSKKIFGSRKLLPLGPLREPIHEIKRADKVVLVNKNHKADVDAFQKEFGIRPAICDMEFGKIYNPKNGDILIEKGNKVFAFCAIGQPEQFYDYLRTDFDLVGTKTFSDHHPYKENEISAIIESARENGAKYIITTQKDFVKIATEEDIFVLQLKQHLDFKELLDCD